MTLLIFSDGSAHLKCRCGGIGVFCCYEYKGNEDKLTMLNKLHTNDMCKKSYLDVNVDKSKIILEQI